MNRPVSSATPQPWSEVSPHRGPTSNMGCLAVVGEWFRTHGRLIRWVQWVVVLVYAFLLIVPACLPLPNDAARIVDNLTVFAQFVFWGIWWPFVLLSMLLFGRLWCGVLCPEGALSEWAARHGRGRAIPKWMRWGGWPFVAFLITTIYGQLVSVYQYPKAAMLVLGGSTVAAVIVGFLYTRGKRAWCRHLCPVNGVFALLSKLAPMHYRVSEARWQASQIKGVRIQAVNCAPLLPLRHMEGGTDCHMCGRCSGHHDAIWLTARSPSEEVVEIAEHQADGWQTALITFGLLGVAIGAFHWTVSPWFIDLKLFAAEWLLNRDWTFLLETQAPWWILTHYPEHNDVFSLLDGSLLVAYIGLTALVMGSGILLALSASVALAGRWQTQRLHHLAQSLIPIAGVGVFLGLSALTVTLLHAEGIPTWWANDLRLGLLVLSNVWCLWLAWQIVGRWVGGLRRVMTMVGPLAALMLVNVAWGFMFWWW